ncbi:polymer-forming cytoskeletal protein [Dyella japonica]|uniref:bactofilin family protein n=1 Tax=Dyella japonica TaxID=231455 RepID=UPI00138F46C6
MTGTVSAEEDGTILTIGESGAVEGSIRVPRDVFSGRVLGDMNCNECLDLGAPARIIGDVYYRTLIVATGAPLDGRLYHVVSGAVNDRPASPDK